MNEASVLNLPRGPRMLEVVRRGLDSAEEARFAVSFTRCSGLQLLLPSIRTLTGRGGKLKLLTSTYQCVTQPDALEALRRLDVDCRVHVGPSAFHSKFWWFRRSTGGECWAGSSNMSKGGLSTNLEWNFRHLDAGQLAHTSQQFDDLWKLPESKALTVDLIAAYREQFLARQSGPLPTGGVVLPIVTPNPAQLEALSALAALRRRGERKVAVIAATGLGKTYLAAFDALAANAQRVLYVSHRLEHLVQAKASFSRALPARRKLGIVGGPWNEIEAEIVFASIQSLRARPELLARRWDYLVIDEFHHADAQSYQKLRPLLEHAFLLGLTATPERQDDRDVLEWCDFNIAYEARLPESIERRWLKPFHYFGVADETVDFEAINWRRLSAEELGKELSVENRVDLVLREALAYGFDGPKRSTVGFCAGVQHARFMAKAFVERGQSAIAVTGDDTVEDRVAIYRRLADPSDPLSWLFVADVLNEGVDIPEINSVLFLRPTESAALFLQQLGRGLRLSPTCEVLTVLDFVGHHRNAWLSISSLTSGIGSGPRVQVGDELLVLPRDCEVVFERRTVEILHKVRRFVTTKKERCETAYRLIKEQSGRRPMPVDLSLRQDVPTLQDFRTAYGTWMDCQRAHGDVPEWAKNLPADHPAFDFLAALERDWQAQRVTPYAWVWACAVRPDDPEEGYKEFFARWPQWSVEAKMNTTNVGTTLSKKLPPSSLEKGRLSARLLNALGAHAVEEIEGRLLFTMNKDFQIRHGGVLRRPADLTLHGQYSRPEIIRHFGAQYDPTKHNGGIVWFKDHGVIVTKLDTRNAKTQFQYENRLLDQTTLAWTTQNNMRSDNEAGRKVLDHQKRGLTLHVFVQPSSHKDATYVGTARTLIAEGEAPMRVRLRFEQTLPADIYRRLLPGAVERELTAEAIPLPRAADEENDDS